MLNRQLERNEFLAGGEYTIADIMCWPWAEGGLGFLDKMASDQAPVAENVRRWVNEISIRPAVIRALDISESRLSAPQS